MHNNGKPHLLYIWLMTNCFSRAAATAGFAHRGFASFVCGMVASLIHRPALALAQTPLARPTAADTVPQHKYENPTGAPAAAKRSFFRSKGFRATVVPAVLIGYGASVINGHGWYSSYDAKRDIHRGFGTYRNHVDDYLQYAPYLLHYAPYLELGGLLLAGGDSRNDRVNRALVVLKSEAIMLGSVFVVKTLAGEQRPDSSDRRSFPSGHTAQAFLAASLVHAEFRDKSSWYGLEAYPTATGAGAGALKADRAEENFHANRCGRENKALEIPRLLPGATPAPACNDRSSRAMPAQGLPATSTLGWCQ